MKLETNSLQLHKSPISHMQNLVNLGHKLKMVPFDRSGMICY